MTDINHTNETPFEYVGGKLGVKIKFLTIDRSHIKSLRLISYNTLAKRMASPTAPETRLRKPAFGRPALILFDSLPREWKDLLTVTFGNPPKQVARSWFAQHYITDQKARDFYVAYRYGNNKALPEDLINQYVYDASMLNTVLTLKRNRTAYARAIGVTQLDIWQSLSNDVNAFTEVPHKLPTNKDALRKKAKKYQKHGYIALISGKLQNANASKIRNAEQRALIDELLAKHTNLDNETIASLYNIVAQQVNWPQVDAQTIANRKKRSALVSYAGRNGLSDLKNNILMQVKRKKPSAPMLFWSADGWDVELTYQATRIDKNGNRLTTYHNRLTAVVIIDPYNNYPVGYAVGTHETPELIQRAYQNAFNHIKELFGNYYMPYQLQTDNYAKKKLSELYQSTTKHYTPAEVGNAKSKPVERYFSYINKKYFRLYDNWSGYNVDSGSKNQPNTEYLNKIKKDFPNMQGAIKQIEAVIQAERIKKQDIYKKDFAVKTANRYKIILKDETYLYLFGQTTGHTNRLTGDGLNITIDGVKRTYDSFDLEFRRLSLAGEVWQIHFDTNNLDKVLAVSTDGRHRYMLEQKTEQPMALADRQEGDAQELQRIFDFNKQAKQYIIDERANNAEILNELFETHPQLNDTLAKHLLTDSNGHHKIQKAQERLQIAEQTQKQEQKETEAQTTGFYQEQHEYLKSKIDVNAFLNQD